MKRLFKRLFTGLGYQVQGIRYCPRHLLDPRYLRNIELGDVICRRMIEVGSELNFVQVGAFDGTTNDPLYPYIRKYGWRGVLVEPQPVPANRLRELYRGTQRIVILQAALDCRGKRTLFTVESTDAPTWAAGMASFERAHITKHSDLIPGLEQMITEITVDCIPFDDVLQYVSPERLDLLQIDAEGYDAHILSLFPFERLKPAIIHWEVKNLTKARREDCFDTLFRHGYRFAPSGKEDMIAVLDDWNVLPNYTKSIAV